jgi:hypothetical protein
MPLSFNNIPLTLSPAYNSNIFNLQASNYQDANFLFSMKLSAGTTTVTNIGTFYKQATNNQFQYYEPSRLVQTQLSYSFPVANYTKLHADGINNIKYIKTVFGAGTATTLTNNYYVFNGYVDRNDMVNFNSYDFIPLSASTRAKFLTPYLTRKVFLDDEGTMSMMNGTFTSSTSAITAENKYIKINTYKNNILNKNYIIYNYLWNDGGLDVTNKRVTFPAYPYNMNNSVGFEFYDNAFAPSPIIVGGFVGFVFTSSISPEWVVGDTIQVYQYPTYTNVSYQGLTTLTWISDDKKSIQTAKGWGVGTAAEPGIIYNINRSSIYSANTSNLYISGLTSASGNLTLKFDTSTGFDAFSIPYGSLIHLHGFGSSSNNITLTASTATTSNTLVTSASYTSNQTGYTTVTSRMVAGPIVDATVNKYTMNMMSQDYYLSAPSTAFTSTPLYLFSGDTYTFNVNNTCSHNDDLFVAWQNKLGAFDYQNFRLRRDTIVNYARNNYTKRLGGNTGQFSYGQNDFEMNNFVGSQDKTYIYNTDWLDDIDSQRILELVGSNVIFAKIDDVWVPIVCSIVDIAYQNKQNNKLAQYTLEFKSTYKTYSQRG